MPNGLDGLSESLRRSGGSLFQRVGAAREKDLSENLSLEVIGGRSRVRQEDERVARGGWMRSRPRR